MKLQKEEQNQTYSFMNPNEKWNYIYLLSFLEPDLPGLPFPHTITGLLLTEIRVQRIALEFKGKNVH